MYNCINSLNIFQTNLAALVVAFMFCIVAKTVAICLGLISVYMLWHSAGISSACRHSMDVTKSMEYFLATGNLVSRTGLGLMQVGGVNRS